MIKISYSIQIQYTRIQFDYWLDHKMTNPVKYLLKLLMERHATFWINLLSPPHLSKGETYCFCPVCPSSCLTLPHTLVSAQSQQFHNTQSFKLYFGLSRWYILFFGSLSQRWKNHRKKSIFFYSQSLCSQYPIGFFFLEVKGQGHSALWTKVKSISTLEYLKNPSTHSACISDPCWFVFLGSEGQR